MLQTVIASALSGIGGAMLAAGVISNIPWSGAIGAFWLVYFGMLWVDCLITEKQRGF